MNIIMIIYFSAIRLVKQGLLLPQAVFLALNGKQRKVLPSEQETERLDRLRNPSKYLGK